jgi:hypothetical protein
VVFDRRPPDQRGRRQLRARSAGTGQAAQSRLGFHWAVR